jgi:hypothetical protein
LKNILDYFYDSGLVAMSIYLKLKKSTMNYLQITIAVFGAIVSILGLVGTFGSPQWLEDKRISMALLFVGVTLVIGALVLFIQDSQQQEKQEMVSAYTGVLRPESTILLSTKDSVSAFPYMEIGDSGVAFTWSGPSGQPFFKIFEDTVLTILEDNGQIKISCKITGQGGLVAEIENNEWRVRPSQAWDRNYNKNALEVRDNNGDIVLQAYLLNDRIQFQGKFYDNHGNGVALVGRNEWGASVIEFTGVDHPKLESSIEPIFMNNSDLHFGEIQRSPDVTSQLAFYNLSGPIEIPSFKADGKLTGAGGEVIMINKYKWNKTEGHVIRSPWKGWLDPPLVIERVLRRSL